MAGRADDVLGFRCHEDLVPHKGSASAVCVDQIQKCLALSETKQAKILWGLLLESSTATGWWNKNSCVCPCQ